MQMASISLNLYGCQAVQRKLKKGLRTQKIAFLSQNPFSRFSQPFPQSLQSQLALSKPIDCLITLKYHTFKQNYVINLHLFSFNSPSMRLWEFARILWWDLAAMILKALRSATPTTRPAVKQHTKPTRSSRMNPSVSWNWWRSATMSLVSTYLCELCQFGYGVSSLRAEK